MIIDATDLQIVLVKVKENLFFVRLDLVSKRREVRHTQVSLAIAGGEGGEVTDLMKGTGCHSITAT